MFASALVGASETVPSSIVRAIVAAVRRRGHDPAPLLAAVDLDEGQLADPRGRVPASAVARLWHDAPRATGDEAFGLAIGESAPEALALAAYLLRASATFGEGLARIGTYYRVFNDVHAVDVQQKDDAVSLIVRTRSSALPAPRHAIEFAFAWVVNMARSATGQELAPLAVRFEHTGPAGGPTAHERLFRCPVAFEEAESELRVPLFWLVLPLATSDPHLVSLLELEAQAELALVPESKSTATRVREALRPLLPHAGGEPTLEAVATKLKTSERTLQRALRDEGTTFQKELDELRRGIAIRRLLDARDPIAAIAFELGFADQSAFHKAFVRWTGRTPGELRRRP